MIIITGCPPDSAHELPQVIHVADPQGGSTNPYNGYLTLGPNNVYFGYSGSDAGGVAMASKDGSSASCIACNMGGPRELIANSSMVYWVDPELGELKRAPLGGGTGTTLWAGSVGTPVALDQSHVYWFGTSNSNVMQANLDGSSPIQVATGQNNVLSIAARSGFLYWVTDSDLVELDLTGGTPSPLAQDRTSPRSVAVDSTHVYWAEGTLGGNERVQRISRGGGTIEQLAAAGAYAIALDDTHVYVADNYGCSIWRVAKTGGTVQILAENQNYPFDIAVDDTAVYWSSESDAKVFKVCK
jgi:hypothetical protein